MSTVRSFCLLALLCLPVWVQAAPTPERARELRSALQKVMQESAPSAAYASYFETFPSSLAEFQELFASDKFRALLEQGMAAGSVKLYFVHACKAYDVVGAERYAEKFLKIATEAGSWGGPPNRDNTDLLTAGHLFQNLLFRADCAESAPGSLHEAIIQAAVRFDDAQLEKMYLSLGWDGMEGAGMEWSPMQWPLDNVCKRAPDRCALTRQLTDKYKFLIEDEPESL